MVPIISTEELKALIDSKGDYTLVDVRREEELNFGVISTAFNIPLGDVENAFDSMGADEFKAKYGKDKCKKGDNLIFYCRTGERSGMAAEIALKLGYSNVKNYSGSIWEWSEIDDRVQRY